MNSFSRSTNLALICLSLVGVFGAGCGSPSESIVDRDAGPTTDTGMMMPDNGMTDLDAGPDSSLPVDEPGIVVMPTTGLITTEAGGSAGFAVFLNTQPTADVTISLTSSDETEGTLSVDHLTFTSVNWHAPQAVEITGVDDATRDGDIDYTIQLAPASTTDGDYNGMTGAPVSVTNIDNESAGVTVSPVTGLVTTESGGTAHFTVVLNSMPSADVMIALASDDAGEGTVAPASLMFTSASWASPQTVTVTGVDDFAEDGAAAYNILVMDPVSDDAEYAAVHDLPSVAVSNTDNDTAGFTVTPTIGIATSEIGGTATFSIVMNSEPSADVTVAVDSDDATEGTVTPTSLTFTSVNWEAPQLVTVTGVDDDAADGSSVYHVVTQAAVSTDLNYDGVDPADVTLVNTDNDTAGLTVSRSSGLRTSEAGASDTFTVALNSQPSTDVTINIVSTDLTEGTVSPATLTFTSLNWNAPQTVTVTGVDDEIGDGLTTYTVRVSPASGGDSAYPSTLLRVVSVQNIDNDTPGITISPGPIATSEAGGSSTISVVLNTAPTADVYILVTLDDVTEAVLSTSVLHFTATNWASPQSIRVTGIDDTENDGDQTFQVGIGPTSSSDPGYDVPDPEYITGVNADDEQPGLVVNHAAVTNTTENGGSFTFTVRLNTIPRGGVNVGITASLNADEVSMSPSSLHFDPDGAYAWNVNQTVTVRGLGDGIVDGDQQFTIRTAITTSEDADYMALAGAAGANLFSGRNADVDVNRIFVSPTGGLTTSEEGRTASFVISVSAAPSANVTINCYSTNEAEGHVLTSPVVFTPTAFGAQTVTIAGVDDSTEDGNVPYNVVCDRAVSSDGTYNNIDPDDVSLTNLDNDHSTGGGESGIQIYPTEGLFSSERGHEADVTVVLSAEPRGRVVIPVSVDRRSMREGRVIVDSLVFDERNWNQPQTLRIIGVDDTDLDGNVAYAVQIGSVESEDPAYNKLDPDDLTVTNYDDEEGSAGLEITPIMGLHTTEWGGMTAFTVVLSAPPERSYSLNVGLDNDVEAKLLVENLNFDRDNWYIPQVVGVVGMDDGDADGDVGYHVTFKVGDCSGLYCEIKPDQVSIVNWDDEDGTPGVVVSDLSNLRTTENGREVGFYVSLRMQPRGSVHMDMYADDSSEIKLFVGSVDFDERNWRDLQYVNFIGQSDDETDGDVLSHIVLQEISSDDERYNKMEPVDVSVVTEDINRRDHFVVVDTRERDLLETRESDSTEFSVYLSDQPEADVCVRVLSDDWTESYTNVAWACFNRDNWRDAQTVTVFGIQDNMDDGDAYSHILIGPAFSDDPAYQYAVGAAPWILTQGR